MDKSCIPNFSELGPSVQKKLLRLPDPGNFCVVCGARTPYGQFLGKRTFKDFCSPAHQAKAVQLRRARTNVEKYGVTCSLSNPKVKAKAQATNMRKYGVSTPLHHGVLREKGKTTLMQKYGVDNPMKSSVLRNRAKETCIEKYGGIGMASPAIKHKIRRSIQSQFGVMNPSQSPIIKIKKAITLEYHYGVRNPSQSAEIQQKKVATCQKNYGTDWYLGSKDCKHRGANEGWYTYNRSKAESDIIFALIHNLGLHKNDIIQGDRKALQGKEIDIWIPSQNIGIEYNGMYWHSEEHDLDRQRMFTKWKLAQANGIQLINIWDYEWECKRDQILNFLEPLVGSNKMVKLSARSLSARNIDFKAAREFCDQYHIQGSSKRMKYCYGLYTASNDLVSVMSFGLHHRNSENIVLNRTCTKSGILVRGGTSKLLTHAIRQNSHWDRIISWSDNRWSSGNVYAKLGFIREANLPPDYRYANTSKHIVLPKQSCTKRKLGALPGETEHQCARRKGLYRIWDCGKVRWSLEL